MKPLLLYLVLGISLLIAPDARGQASLLKPLKPHEVAILYLAADVPHNQKPDKVWYKKDPGHVFVILERIDTLLQQKETLSWGFYPIHPISSIFFRKVKCELRDNGGHEYDAVICKQLSIEEFQRVQQQTAALAQRKYHINKYNCYDYAVELFNSVAGAAVIPLHKVKFPFVMGQGGSPCALYSTLQALQDTSVVWTNVIQFGCFIAPETGQKPVQIEMLTINYHP